MDKIFSNLTREELELFKKLDSPRKIQDFLNSIEINFEENGETCLSPRQVIQKKKAHCVEGAVLAASILYFHGEEPLILDLESSKKDFDHVVCLFQREGRWGAIGKTNHAVLRYREPIYRDIQELVMSFFHEYFLDNGVKTLRRFSEPVNLRMFNDQNWITSEENWFIPEYLTEIPHKEILTKSQIQSLRKADQIEIEAGKLVEYQSKQ